MRQAYVNTYGKIFQHFFDSCIQLHEPDVIIELSYEIKLKSPQEYGLPKQFQLPCSIKHAQKSLQPYTFSIQVV
jgi:hypothetical protein